MFIFLLCLEDNSNIKFVNKLHYQGHQFLVLKLIYSVLAWGIHEFEEVVSLNRIADFLDALQHNYSYSPLWLCVYMCVQAISLSQATMAVFLKCLQLI